MTEADALQRWCPYAHHSDGGSTSFEYGAPVIRLGTAEVKCIGSHCMAWRWSRAKETAAYLQAVQERMKSTGENFNVATNKVYAEIGSTFDKTEGFCGAFGAES